MKICTKCSVPKNTTDFPKDKRKKDGLNSACKECRNKSNANWLSKNPLYYQKHYGKDPEKHKAKGRAYYHANKEKQRNSGLLRRYGISAADYELLLKEQNGKCAICGSTESGRNSEPLFVDHDHAKGTVRGLLCHSCNVGIGKFKDNEELLYKAIRYLKENKRATA